MSILYMQYLLESVFVFAVYVFDSFDPHYTPLAINHLSLVSLL